MLRFKIEWKGGLEKVKDIRVRNDSRGNREVTQVDLVSVRLTS